MPVDGAQALLPSIGDGLEQALAACSDPAWIIDPGKARVLGANAAGAARLGLRPDAASGTLDATMPGLVRLRAMLQESLNGGRREPLVFWTAYGAESLVCDVTAVPDAPASLVLVSIASGAHRRLALPPPGAAIAALPPPPPPSADDAATMTKIASAIRNGFAGGRSDPDAAATEAPEADAPAQAAQVAETAVEVSTLAHELRTPLSAIAAAAEIMKDQRFGSLENERYRGYTSDIHDNARHALALINRLLGGELAAATPEALEAVETDLNALAESSVSAVQPLAEEAGLKLTHEFHAQLPLVKADATTVRQILFNLLTNAIKFTPRGGDVRVVTGLGFDRSVFIAVQDTGAGMSEEAIETALKAELPANPARKDAGGGHGIGLPLTRSLAEANGARIEIDSAVGEGTAVALVFPRDRVVPRAD